MSNTEHTSTRYDSELNEIRSRVLEMGALVEAQLRDAIASLSAGDVLRMTAIVENDHRVNALEVLVDEQCVQVIARRQPTAIDLRLVMAVIKTITDLERIGDEAKKIAQMGRLLALDSKGPEVHHFHEIPQAAAIALEMLHAAMQAFAALDTDLADHVGVLDDQVDERFHSVLRHLISYMIEDPRTISSSLSILTIIKAIERIGDHAENISEYVIYQVKGRDVRHLSDGKV